MIEAMPRFVGVTSRAKPIRVATPQRMLAVMRYEARIRTAGSFLLSPGTTATRAASTALPEDRKACAL